MRQGCVLAAAACVAICCAEKKRVQSSFLVCPLLQSMSKYSSNEMLQDFELDDQDFSCFIFTLASFKCKTIQPMRSVVCFYF